MKNKGFTLVEILGVIILLGLIFMLSYTTILNNVKKSQNKIDESTLKLLTSATKDYMNDHQDEYGKDEYVVCINVSTLVDENYIDEDTITAKDNSIISKIMKVTYDDDMEYELVNSCKSGKSFIKYLLTKTNDISVATYEIDSDASHQMYTFNHDETEQTEALTDYRYIGSDPYNYVDFNGETWRIIGVFTVENENGTKEKRIKLIRNEIVARMAWNDNWSDYWPESTLKNYLNEDYYNNQLIHDSAKKMIEPAKYYLGRGTSDAKYGPAPAIYNWERRTEQVWLAREFNWIGNVGLMYPSDYSYSYANGVDDECYNNGFACSKNRGAPKGWIYINLTQKWIAEWTISSYAPMGPRVYRIHEWGQLNYETPSLHTGSVDGVRPVVYLKSKVQITDGDGTQDNPYQLQI